MKLLIDADFIVYKSCAAAETEIDWGDDVIMVTSRFSDAMQAVRREIEKIKTKFMWDIPEIILFFSDSTNFRKEILPSYKGHRNRKKPCGYKRVINELKKHIKLLSCLHWRLMMLWESTPPRIPAPLSAVLIRI